MSLPTTNQPPHEPEKSVLMAAIEPDIPDNHEYPTGTRLAAIISSIFIAMFLVALVRVSPHLTMQVADQLVYRIN